MPEVQPLFAFTAPLRLTLAAALSLLAGCGDADLPREDPLRRFQVMGADLEQGRRLMERYQCGSCHAVPGVAAASGRNAPSLAGFGRRGYIAGELPNTPEQLQRWLLNPAMELTGTTMPRLGVSEDDARDMAGYLMSLR